MCLNSYQCTFIAPGVGECDYYETNVGLCCAFEQEVSIERSLFRSRVLCRV